MPKLDSQDINHVVGEQHYGQIIGVASEFDYASAGRSQNSAGGGQFDTRPLDSREGYGNGEGLVGGSTVNETQ